MKPSFLLIVTAATVLAAAPAANAELFCVNTASCAGGTPIDDVQQALDAAAHNNAQDTLRIGPRSTPYEGPFSYVAVERISIVGAGRDETVLRSDSATATLRLLSPTSEVRDLSVENRAAAGDSTALHSDASARNVRIHNATPGQITRAVAADGAFVIEQSAVTSLEGRTFESQPDSSVQTIRDTTFSGGSGVSATAGGTLSVSRASITARRVALTMVGTLAIDDTVLRTTAPAPADGALTALAGSSVTGNHLTIVGSGAGRGVAASAAAGKSTNVTLSNSVVAGFANTAVRDGNGGTANLTLRYSSFANGVGAFVQYGDGVLSTSTGNTTAAPVFVDPTIDQLGDQLDHRLRAPSPLIDAGDPADRATADRLGLDRVVDGDGDGGDRSDMGAYEYQRGAPTAGLTAPDTAQAGSAAIDVTGTGADSDGDLLTYSWDFGDGTATTGKAASHVYAAAGSYAITLTVTDAGGRSATAVKQIAVSAPPLVDQPQPPADQPQPPAGQPQPPAGQPQPQPPVTPQTPPPSPQVTDKLAPALTALKAYRTRIAFRSSESATVTVTFARRLRGGSYKKLKQALVLSARKGANTVKTPKTLRTGAFKVTLAATDLAGNRAKPRTLAARRR
jgi:hypothetical protein